jgi:peptidoglycan/xylan/chitin deacetylase (PgdA/CDA1 family)
VVLTFDDNLRCQYDVAYPVLRERGLTACWFVYTSVLEDVVETLELYRHFRCSYFGDIDAFYDAFFERVTRSPYADDVACALVTFEPRNYLVDYPFYSDTDRTFRFVRDEILAVDAYEEVMDCMLDDRCVDRAAVASHLWMDGGALRDLHEAGHVIGLHSHTHPTVLAALDARRQREQYERNYEAVRACTGESPTTMSHPTNSYNVDTLKILRSLGVDIGFRADMCGPATSALEHPRQDHANLLAAAKGRP